MRFSVVIPAYNAAAYLGETLESLARQTYRDFEVLIVDDGSTDDTVARAEAQLAGLGLRGSVIQRPSHVSKGVSSCRNIGITTAQGDWVAFLDSDDLFVAEKLERVAATVDRSSRSVRAIYHKSRRFADGTRAPLGIQTEYGREGEPMWLLDKLLVGNFHATCGMVIATDLLREIGGFHPSLHGVEDWWLVIQVSSRTPWLFIAEELAEIRIRESSLMTNAPFAHYVRQHVALLDVARRSGELSAHQVAALRAYCLGPLNFYFSGEAFGRGGWGAIAPGIARLVAAGEWSAAARLIVRHLRAEMLATAWRLSRRLLPRRARA